MDSQNKIKRTYRIDPQVDSQIHNLAASSNSTPSNVVRAALANYLSTVPSNGSQA